MEEAVPGRGLRDHFADLPDPRVERTKRHRLLDVGTIAVCAVVCGADTWVAVEQFGHRKRAFLAQFLDLPHGIPSHDTFGRVFAALDPVAFERLRSPVPGLGPGHGAADGRPGGGHRRQDAAPQPRPRRRPGSAPPGQRLGDRPTASCWGRRRLTSKSNEITAIPALLDVLALGGCVVTIDAMGCQKGIARTIRARAAAYVLALKDNHPHLATDVASVFADAVGPNAGGDAVGYAQTLEKGHGRIERRRCWTIADPRVIDLARSERCLGGPADRGARRGRAPDRRGADHRAALPS